jgi:hypothetical protein
LVGALQTGGHEYVPPESGVQTGDGPSLFSDLIKDSRSRATTTMTSGPPTIRLCLSQGLHAGWPERLPILHSCQPCRLHTMYTCTLCTWGWFFFLFQAHQQKLSAIRSGPGPFAPPRPQLGQPDSDSPPPPLDLFTLATSPLSHITGPFPVRISPAFSDTQAHALVGVDIFIYVMSFWLSRSKKVKKRTYWTPTLACLPWHDLVLYRHPKPNKSFPSHAGGEKLII